MIKDTGVTQTDTHVSAQGEEDGSRSSQCISDDTASQQSGFMVGNSEDMQSLSPGKDLLYTNQRLTFVKVQLKRKRINHPTCRERKKLIAVHIQSPGKIKHID